MFPFKSPQKTRLLLRIVFLMLCVTLTSVVVHAQETAAQPDMVVIPGTLQSALGCDSDWLPDGDCTALTFSAEDNVWMGTFDIPAGSYEYKVAINGAWTENYGGMADADGPNVQLELAEDTSVTFIYDSVTHWVSDSVNHIVANVPGSFQAAIGCPGDWSPDCLRSWLQDPDGDGVYTFVTTAISQAITKPKSRSIRRGI
ncbi:MAG: hypothetical protein U0694_18415 [Anaerolineae bacterium]